jgi:hypothetical protein
VARLPTALPIAAVGLVVAAAVACAPTTGPASTVALPPLDVEIRGQMADREAMPWSASRRLTWPDFRGTAPAGGMEGAQTAYGLFYGLRCTRTVFQFDVITGFLPKESWVKPSVLANGDDSRRTLEHEQTHFDLAEVYARRMRRYFTDLVSPCDQSLDRWRSIAERFVRDEATAQDRYDDETRHGLLAIRQQAWNTEVATQLGALGEFAR